ncbi:MAG: aminotransferase class I/II-fold pyridoxal phosphate-dependent enzyme [Clostridiales Family XIII bacterium]|jgi:threonine aldolase|nr:aminotransferase class I/II-fold pyridoxal phosphate-dependent enzyme [Clostridiales Family XIII bacterium]
MTKRVNLLNDYNSPAHPCVLEAIARASGDKFVGYGEDGESDAARAALRSLLRSPDADIHFLVGGTQANLTAIGAFLRPHEAVIAPASAHINTHETGAVEATGHKILTVDRPDGKIGPADVQGIMGLHGDEHMVKPRLLFISQSTEFGTVYTKAELAALRDVCDNNHLYLYIDGARLGYALTAEKCDFELPELCRIADAFYIGGTKNGLLFGEALVLCNPSLRDDFRYHMKQRGGLLAKGYLLGIQFQALFNDDLYFKMARHANEMAQRLHQLLAASGYAFEIDTESNQLFPIVRKQDIPLLEEQILFNRWNALDGDRASIRLITTWNTTEQEIQEAARIL